MFSSFAILVQNVSYKISGKVSLASIAQFICYEVFGHLCISWSFFLYLDILFCYNEAKVAIFLCCDEGKPFFFAESEHVAHKEARG
jgi:hypothetical protein